MRSFMLKIH